MCINRETTELNITNFDFLEPVQQTETRYFQMAELKQRSVSYALLFWVQRGIFQ